MKKILFAFSLSFFFLISVSAQIISPRVGFGLTTYATAGGKQTTEITSILRFHLGAQYEHIINNNIHGITGLIIEGKGAKATNNKSGFVYDAKFKPVYLIIPIGIKYIIEGSSLKFFTNGEIYTGIGLGGKATINGTWSYSPVDKEEKAFGDGGLKRLDFGVEFGGGVIMPIANHDVEFGLLLSFGLTNLGDASNMNGNTMKNQAFKIYVALPLSDIFK